MNSRELREQRAKIAKQMAELAEKRATWTAEDRANFDKMDADQNSLLADIQRIEKSDELTKSLRSAPPEAEIKAAAKEESKEQRVKKYRDAYFRAMACGRNDYEIENGMRPVSAEDRAILADAELRAEATGGGNALQGSGGGYFVPVGFVNDIETAMKYYGPMLQSSTILETASGQPLPHPTVNDTSTVGVQVDENAEVTTPTDLAAISTLTLNAYKFTSGIEKVSIELLQDSAFNLDPYLRERMAERVGRVLNTKFTTGPGTTTPKGIVVASTSSAQTVIGDDNATTPNPLLEVGYQDLVNLEHSVDILYRRGAAFMFHDGTLQFLKKLKDKYGRPLWTPGMTSGEPDRILGYPYWINNDMARCDQNSPAVARKSVLFGQLQKYIVRRVKDFSLVRLTERFAEFGQVAYIGFCRYDGNLLDAGTNPVKYLTNPAS